MVTIRTAAATLLLVALAYAAVLYTTTAPAPDRWAESCVAAGGVVTPTDPSSPIQTDICVDGIDVLSGRPVTE